MNPRLLVSVASAAALCAALDAAPAAAQEQAAGTTLSEVVVTAEFREQNLQQTPLAITAVNADMLEQRSITSVVDVAQAAPNVTMRLAGGGGGNSNQTFIRGIGQGDFLYAYEPRVAFYVDDVYHSTVFGTAFDVLDVDRIEVLRGPQGTLFGRNAVGGAIRIFSRKPRGDGSGYVEVLGGSDNYRSLRGAFDVPIVEDRLMMRVAASYRERDGWVDRYSFPCLYPSLAGLLPNTAQGGGTGRSNCKVGTLGEGKVFSARAQLRWVVNDRIENNFTLEYTDDDSRAPTDVLIAPLHFNAQNPTTGAPRAEFAAAPNGLALWFQDIGGPFYGLNLTPELASALYPNDPYVSYAAFGNPGLWVRSSAQPSNPDPGPGYTNPPISTVQQYGFSNVLDVDISDSVHLKSVTAFRGYTGEFGQSDFAIFTRDVYNEVSHHQWSEELTLSGVAFNDRLDWTIGGFYLDSYNRNDGRVQFEGFGIAIGLFPTPGIAIGQAFRQEFLINDPATLKNKSAFAHGVLHVTDRLNLTAGIRYTHEEKTYTFSRYYLYFAGNPTIPSSFVQKGEGSFEKWTPRFAVDYQLAENLFLYASFSKGFTAGGFNGRPFGAQDVFPIGPENVTAYEAGFRSEWLDRRLRLNATAYFTKFDDIQITLAGCPSDPTSCRTTSPFYVDNGGNAEIKGFEVELEARPTPEWLITGSVGYADFQYTELNPLVNVPSAVYDGQPNPFGLSLDSPQNGVPKWKVALATQYDIDLGGLGTLTPHIDAVYQSTVYFDTVRINPFTTQEGYWLANARVTWRSADNDWQVALGVTNLFDKLYFNSKTDLRNGFGYALGNVAPPRRWQVSLRRNF